MAPHIIDLPIWALGLGFPTGISSSGGRFAIGGDGDAYDTHEVLWRYPQTTLTWMSTLGNSYGFDFHGRPQRARRLGIYFHGVNGTMYANYGEHRIIPEGELLDPFILPEVAARKRAKDFTAREMYMFKELKPVEETIPPSPGHERQWLDSVRSRVPPDCNPDYHVRVDVPIVLSLLSLKLGRSIRLIPRRSRLSATPRPPAWPCPRTGPRGSSRSSICSPFMPGIPGRCRSFRHARRANRHPPQQQQKAALNSARNLRIFRPGGLLAMVGTPLAIGQGKPDSPFVRLPCPAMANVRSPPV